MSTRSATRLPERYQDRTLPSLPLERPQVDKLIIPETGSLRGTSKPPTIQPRVLRRSQIPFSSPHLRQYCSPVSGRSSPASTAASSRSSRTLFGESSAPVSPSKKAQARKYPKNRIPFAPRDVYIDFSGLWTRFVEVSLNPLDYIETLHLEKAEHPLGRASVDRSPFHAVPLLDRPSVHSFKVIVNADPAHLNKWKKKTGLESVTPNDDFMEELFLRVTMELEREYGWIRQDMSTSSSARHWVTRPLSTKSLSPHPTNVDQLFLPRSSENVIARQTDFWGSSLAQQLQAVRAHRHPTLGLVFHSWMNTPSNVETNAGCVPPPIWFMLYALQAAHPGIIVIKESTENSQWCQEIERGLPPYEVLTDKGVGSWFLGMLGEEAYERTCEAALDARESTEVKLVMKGSVKLRKRANSSTDGLPVSSREPDGGTRTKSLRQPMQRRSSFSGVFKRPAWLRS